MSEDKPVTTPNHFFIQPWMYGFYVPVLQVLFTAAAWAVTAGGAVLSLAWLGVPIPVPFKFAAVFAGLAFSIVILIEWPRRLDRWMWLIEVAIGQDLNGDGAIGAPVPAPPPSFRVELTMDNGRQTNFYDLPVTPEQLKALAVGVIHKGKGLAVDLWVGNGQPFKRSEFDQLRAEMLSRGLLELSNPNNPNNGVRPTKAGFAVLRYIADRYTPPTPI